MSGSNSSAPGSTAVDPLAAPGHGAEPLSFTVHSMPATHTLAQGAEDQRRTASGRWKMLLVLLACAAPVVASYFTYYVVRPQGRTNYSTLIEPSRALPPTLPLHDLDGHAVSPASLAGQWLLVVVGDAACPADCDKRLFMQRQLREMTGRDRDRIDKLWLVTDDAPLRPELRARLQAEPAMQVLRAPRAAVAAWLAPQAGEPLDAHLYIVDPLGEWMMRSPPQPDPAKLKRDIDRLLRGSAGWDRAGR